MSISPLSLFTSFRSERGGRSSGRFTRVTHPFWDGVTRTSRGLVPAFCNFCLSRFPSPPFLCAYSGNPPHPLSFSTHLLMPQ
ncbi:hypothetical protein CEXT_11261 [Caerostris extrusa]|uniref:Uncharacterized protein n=1 Tax=Caerostris extrusa TaxID=172846 RepID=A0AAV4MSZ4_CAEEX|nr:hypothetical protein CEXT_11261 [Caerostris extrusa]